MVHSREITARAINHMTMTEYAAFRQGTSPITFERTYEFCRRMYIETGSMYWLDEMIQRVSPWETGG